MHLAGLKRLRTLVLWNCMRVTVDGLGVLSSLAAIADLSLRGCAQLSDALCASVAHLSALTRLDLRACERFTGSSPQLLSSLEHQGPSERCLKAAEARKGAWSLGCS